MQIKHFQTRSPDRDYYLDKSVLEEITSRNDIFCEECLADVHFPADISYGDCRVPGKLESKLSGSSLVRATSGQEVLLPSPITSKSLKWKSGDVVIGFLARNRLKSASKYSVTKQGSQQISFS